MDQSLTRYWFYVLFSLKDRKLYKGTCADIGTRFFAHNSGGTTSTRHRRPLVLIYLKPFDSKQDALKFERFSKTLEGGVRLRQLLNELNLPEPLGPAGVAG